MATQSVDLTDKQKKLLDRIKNEAHLIGHLVGFDKLTTLHSSWANKMLKTQSTYVLQAHRGSYKSSLVVLVIALLMILYPNKTILYMRKTEDDVKEIIEKVSKILHHEVFQYFSQILYGATYQFTKDTAYEINTTLKTDMSGKSQLMGLGSSTSLTGKHVDIVIVDDLCFCVGTKIATPFGDRNIEDLRVGDLVLTPNGCEKIVSTSNRKAKVITNVGLCGTPNHPVYSKIKKAFVSLSDITEDEIVRLNDTLYSVNKKEGIETVYNIEVENSHVYYANGILVHNCNIKDRVSRAERERIKNIWMELQNVKNRDGKCIAIGTKWHPEDVFSLMPEPEIHTCYDTGLMTEEQIQEIKAVMTPALFAANYELKFVASEDALFTDIRYEKDYRRDTNLPDDIVIKDLIERGICHLDASYGGDDTTAFTIMKRQPDGKIIAFGKVWDKHVKEVMSEIITLKNYYLAGTLFLENNGDKGYLAQEFRNRGVRCVSYHESMNKDRKIQTHLYGAWQNIYWLDKTDANYINQIMDYVENSTGLVDAPDSAACCVQRIGGSGGRGSAIDGLRI